MIIAGYSPCSLIDYPGFVSAVVFTQGCNWRCPWCHNKGLIPMKARAGALSVEEVFSRLEARKGKLDAVVVTGGEPTLHVDLPSFLSRVRILEFGVKLDSNGSNPQMLRSLLEAKLLDFVAMDLKAPWGRYAEAVGIEVDVEALKESVALLRSFGVAHHLRTTRWPGLEKTEDSKILEISQGSPHVWQHYREPAST